MSKLCMAYGITDSGFPCDIILPQYPIISTRRASSQISEGRVQMDALTVASDGHGEEIPSLVRINLFEVPHRRYSEYSDKGNRCGKRGRVASIGVSVA